MPLRRSDLQNTDFTRFPFLWATGIEDTFITEPWPATGRILDEYELTDHYSRWRSDLDLVASLGVRTARYGVPWHRINPEPGKWDWRWADKPLGYLIDLGIDPIVDLVHYGTPSWIDGAFINPNYPHYVSEFARRLAERFAGRIHCYTPLNEPRITAWYCGRLGWWPPHLHGIPGFLKVMLGVCRGIVETTKALRDVDPENVIVHVDATDLYQASDGQPELALEASRRQRIVFLAMDLLLGRVDREHPLWEWILRNGVSQNELLWFTENHIQIDICGINLYPIFSQKVLTKGSRGVRIKMPYASADIIAQLSDMYFARYGVPIMVTETATRGPISTRSAWLKDCVAAIRNVREGGIPLIGYTWWPMFSLVAWAYRQGERDASAYLEKMGLWDLDGERLERVETPLVDEYRQIIAAGREAYGPLVPGGIELAANDLVGAAA